MIFALEQTKDSACFEGFLNNNPKLHRRVVGFFFFYFRTRPNKLRINVRLHTEENLIRLYGSSWSRPKLNDTRWSGWGHKGAGAGPRFVIRDARSYTRTTNSVVPIFYFFTSTSPEPADAVAALMRAKFQAEFA